MTNNNSTSKPKLQLVKENPAAAAVISKAIKAQYSTGFDVTKKSSYYGAHQGKFRAISESQKKRAAENENIMELFPDIVLAEQIITSCILSPKDMYTGDLIYQTMTDIVPATIQQQINNVIKEHLESYYKFDDELPEIIRAALFRSGSYVAAVIPEAAIDEIINGRTYSLESDRPLIDEIIDNKGNAVTLGILGSPDKKTERVSSLESFFSGSMPNIAENHVALEGMMILEDKQADTKKKTGDTIFNPSASTAGFLEITDNYQLLKLPTLMAAISQQRIKRAIKNPLYSKSQKVQTSFATESADPKVKVNLDKKAKPLSPDEFKAMVYKNAPPSTDQFLIFPDKDNQRRYSIGRPLRMRIPSEAVIPVYPPGDPKNHRGYFILVDANGNWVTRSSIDTTNSGLASLVGTGGGLSDTLTGSMLQKAKTSITDTNSTVFIDNMLEIYGSIVENDMLNRLRNGAYGTQMEIGKDKEWDRIMLSRALSGKMTRLVYMPKEFITYYAYDYHENGVGKSYLDRIRMLTSIRAMLLFSKIMAQLKNAINITKVNMSLDESDPDPEKTIEMAAHDIMRLRGAYFPLGVNDPNELFDWIQRAGLMFEFGEHPGLPNTKFDFSNVNMQHQVPDPETSDDLRKQTFMTFGVTPEMIDNISSEEFATSILQKNAMFAKRISLLSNTTASLMSPDVRNICKNDTLILTEIMNIVKEAGEDVFKYLSPEDKIDREKNPTEFLRQFVERIVENIWVDLPKPDVTSNNVKAEEFNNMSEMIDKVLDSFISEEVFAASFSGDFATHAPELKKVWKHFLLRKWVTDEGFLPEIAEIFKRDENGNPSNDVLEMMTGYAKDVMMPAMKFLQKMKMASKATDQDLKNLGISPGTDTPSDTEEGGDSGNFGGNDNLNTGVFDFEEAGTAPGPEVTPAQLAADEDTTGEEGNTPPASAEPAGAEDEAPTP